MGKRLLSLRLRAGTGGERQGLDAENYPGGSGDCQADIPALHIGIQHFIADEMNGAFPVHGLEILAAAVICAVLSLALPPESHSPAAVSAFKKSRKDMRGSIALCPAAVCNLPLYLIEYVTGNDGFMGILNANPFRFRVPGQRFVFEGRHGQSVMDAVSDVVFIFQNLLDRRDIPRIAFFLRLTFIKPGVGSNA